MRCAVAALGRCREMRYVFVSAILGVMSTLILGAVACGDGAPQQAAPTPSATSSAIDFSALAPEPVGPVPQGVLVVQKESQSATTFGIAADGSIINYGQGVHFVTSPDGRSVAVVKRDGSNQPSGVGIVTADGREVFEVQTPQASHGADPIFFPTLLWSPDGSRLAYTLSDGANTEQSWVYTVSTDGSGRRRITDEAGNYYLIGWTGDGQILVHSGGGLVLMGTKSRDLPLPEEVQSYDSYLAFEISPDGRYVAIYGGDLENNLALWVLEVESGRSWLVADMGYIAAQPASGLYVSAGIPLGLEGAETDDLVLKGPPPVIWSPDSRRIAYYRIAYYRSRSDEGEGYASELRVVNVESGRDIGVTQDPSWLAAWSADGRYLAEPAHEAGNVVVLSPDGSTAALDVRADQISWADGGKLIAAQPGGLSLVDPDSGEIREALTAEGAKIYGAQIWGEAGIWSPDGRYLAFATSKRYHRKADSSLYLLDGQTSQVTLVVEGGYYQPVGWLSE